jgi:hypothetical protein
MSVCAKQNDHLAAGELPPEGRTESVFQILLKRMALMSLISMTVFLPSISGRAHANSAKRNQSQSTSRLRRHSSRGKHKENPQSQPSPLPLTVAETETIRLQREKFEFDKEKSKSDADRAERSITVEKSKAIWSAIATAFPLLAAALAIFFGFLSQNRQAKLQSQLNEAQAKSQFELKAAEIMFSVTTPQAIIRRGRALKKIFGARLSNEFLGDLEPKDIGGDTEPVDGKVVFLDHLLKDPEKKAEIIRLWFHLFPGDFKWLMRIDPEQFRDIDLPEIQELLAKVEPPKETSLEGPRLN